MTRLRAKHVKDAHTADKTSQERVHLTQVIRMVAMGEGAGEGLSVDQQRPARASAEGVSTSAYSDMVHQGHG